jgi:ribose transport system permease protein
MPDRILASLHSRPWLFAAALTAALLIGNVLAQPSFGNPHNWPQELATLAPIALVAFASTPSIASGGGGLDLSVGPLAVLTNVILVESLFTNGITSAWVCVPIVLGLGLLVGVVNGILVGYFRYVPLIATLCMLFVIGGISLKVGATSHTADIRWANDLAGKIGPVPGALLLMGVPVLIWLALGRTSFHRTLYGTGANDVTAFSAGVNVAFARAAAYALGGLFAAMGGIALTALVQSSQAASTTHYVLVGLTAVALGGISLRGGRGGMACAFFGASALYLIQTLLANLNVAPDWLNVVYGLLLIAGVFVGAVIALLRPAHARGAPA